MGKKKVTLEEIFGKAIDEEMMHGTAFAEVGMAKVLANLAKKHFKEKALEAVGDDGDIDEVPDWDRDSRAYIGYRNEAKDEIRKRIKEAFK